MNHDPALDVLLDCAEAAARTAGRHALDHATRRHEIHARFAHDVKLALDFECQAVAEKVIRERFPTHAVLGEESTDAACGSGEYTWIIDPIDGTVNFFHGLPLWCCSVAVQVRGVSVAGAVFAPVLDVCYTAHAEGPARCNGRPLTVSPVDQLAEAIVSTGIDKQPEQFEPSMEQFRTLSTRTHKLRIMGSAALDICHVAQGAADGFYEAGIYIWDIAAGELIVRRAGGRAETLGTRPQGRLKFLATNGRIHDEIKRWIL